VLPKLHRGSRTFVAIASDFVCVGWSAAPRSSRSLSPSLSVNGPMPVPCGGALTLEVPHPLNRPAHVAMACRKWRGHRGLGFRVGTIACSTGGNPIQPRQPALARSISGRPRARRYCRMPA
jgi:hypothetical protein